ncbi:MAG: hypothetical protein HOV81_42640 [Kofleriaceae bacterium]|nr:hypothetical protein [Kofleriaceae bacterium]
MTPQHPLVELAQGALDRLAAVPGFGESVKGRAAEVERLWVRAPLLLAIGGGAQARSELFNYLLNRKVLDPETRPVGSAALRIRRGPVTRFEATRDDGTTESHELRPEQTEKDVLRMRETAARAEVADRKLALERIEKTLPRMARARPRGLMIWMWPIWWLLTRRHRRMLADRKFTELAYDQSCDALKVAETDARNMAEQIRIERGRFFESLRALASAPSLGGTVREVLLELGDGPLPPGVEMIELTRASQATEQVDAIFLVEKDTFHAPDVADGNALPIGKISDVVPVLPMLLGRARTFVIAKRAREELAPPVTALDDEVNDTEDGFRVRIERLEAMQILVPEEFARAELSKVRPQIAQSVHAVIEHARAHLGGELARLGDEWLFAITVSKTNDDLKNAVSRIENSEQLDARRIAEEVRRLAMGGAVGSVQDILPELLASLKPHGLDEPGARSAPQLNPIDMLPSLTAATSKKVAKGWLGGLFKSFETKRIDVHTKAQARIAHLVEVASAEILDTEPKLASVIEQALYAELIAAIGRQAAWLDAALVAEREAVVREGIILAPLSRARDRLRADLSKLVDGIAQLEKGNAGLSQAASAALSAQPASAATSAA